ncbi:MAG: hypothetical protein ACN6LP_01000 [Candidatus Carsonella ruddii]
MFFNYINHINVFFCFFKNNNYKVFFQGTNSKNCFIKKKNNFFFSIVEKKNIIINNIKILQNKIKISTKNFFFSKRKLLFKKINGFVLFFFNKNILSKISNCISLKLKKNFFKFYNKIPFFYFKNKNFFKFFFNFKKINNILSLFYNHNDLFKDNIIIKGNFLCSLIDLNNFIYSKINNDLNTLILEFSFNYFIKKNILIENYYKFNKKNLNLNNYIFKNFILRKKKMIIIKKTKNPFKYLKKLLNETIF